MGVYHNEQFRGSAPSPSGRAWLIRARLVAPAACLLSALLAAPVSSADTPASPPRPTPSDERPVSMSPEPERAQDPEQDPLGQAAGSGSTQGLPLTRAAARQRVETVSPLPWLSRFGPVVVEQAE